MPDYDVATDEQLYVRGAQLSINKLPLRLDLLTRDRYRVAGSWGMLGVL